MKRLRFFATLHFARGLPSTNRELKRLAIKAFHYGYLIGWQDKGSKYVMSEVR